MSGNLQISQRDEGKLSIIKFAGRIDQEADYSVLVFEEGQIVVFDFEEVKFINSSGIQKWIGFFAEIPDNTQIEFVKCPLRIITQINLIPDFLCNKKVTVSSFYAPYFCEECDESKNILLNTESYFPDSKSPQAPEMNCEHCGAEMEFDGLEKKYFTFLTRSSA